MKIKTSELIGPALAYAITVAEEMDVIGICTRGPVIGPEGGVLVLDGYLCESIIKKYKVWLSYYLDEPEFGTKEGWQADIMDGDSINTLASTPETHPEPVVSVCRVAVMLVCGDEIDIPEELLI